MNLKVKNLPYPYDTEIYNWWQTGINPKYNIQLKPIKK